MLGNVELKCMDTHLKGKSPYQPDLEVFVSVIFVSIMKEAFVPRGQILPFRVTPLKKELI